MPKFIGLINDKELNIFLDNLSNVYKWKRYGEARSTVNSLEVAKLLDRIVDKLRIIHSETIKGSVSKLYVPDDLKQTFLKNNEVFNASKITSYHLALFAFPGMPDMET